MPLDPTIPLQAVATRPQQINTPSQTLENIGRADLMRATVDQQGLENQLLQQRVTAEKKEAADRAAAEQIFKDSGGDIEKAIPQIMQINPKLGLELQELAQKEAKANFERVSAGLKKLDDQLATGMRIAAGITDQTTFDLLKPGIERLSPEISGWLGTQYDPAKQEQLLQWGSALKALNDTRLDALKTFADGKPQQALAGWLSTARNQQEWDGALNSPEAFGVPRSQATMLKNLFGEYSPEAVERAKALHQQGKGGAGTRAGFQDVALNIGGRKVGGSFDRESGQYFVNGQPVNNAQLWREPNAPSQEPLEYVVGDDGKPALVPRSQAVGKQRAGQSRPVSEGEKKNLSFYERMKQAEETITTIENEIQQMGDIGRGWVNNAPEWLQGDLGKKYLQAQRQFTEARLRKESGAAIANSEYANDRLTNFMQPGDSPERLAQKRRSRQSHLATTAFAAGQALGQFYEDPEEAQRIIAEHKRLAAEPGKGGGGGVRGKVKPADVPKDVAANKPTDPKKARRVRKRENGVMFEYVVYADGSADKTEVK